MEKLDKPTEPAVRRSLDLLADRYDVAGVVVFGSRARGTHRTGCASGSVQRTTRIRSFCTLSR